VLFIEIDPQHGKGGTIQAGGSRGIGQNGGMEFEYK
jgi:hypothetical protein